MPLKLSVRWLARSGRLSSHCEDVDVDAVHSMRKIRRLVIGTNSFGLTVLGLTLGGSPHPAPSIGWGSAMYTAVLSGYFDQLNRAVRQNFMHVACRLFEQLHQYQTDSCCTGNHHKER